MVDWIETAGNLLLFALVFGMSATVDINCLKEQLHNRNAILTGIFLQFVVLPLLGFLVVNILDLDSAIGITLLVLTSSPGGSYSNWWCSMFNADLALSVTMTAISTLLSTIFLPVNLLIYARYSYEADVIMALDWTSLFVALAIVIGAIGLGLFCSAKIHSHKFNLMANHLGNWAGIALIIFSATMTNTGGEDTKIWERDWKFYVGTTLPCLLGLIIANLVTSTIRLKKPERVTASVECCYQNVGIATSVALTMFEGDELSEAMGVPFFYGVVEAVILGIYCIGAWKLGWTKAPKNASIWKILTTSYEVIYAEVKELDEIEIKVSDSDDAMEDELSEDGNVLTTYFYMGSKDKDKPKEPSGLVTESTEAILKDDEP
jgi:predicted Na+-dependent transporter